VALDGAEFEVAVGRIPQEGGALTIEGQQYKAVPTGINQVDFRIRTNPGMPMGSLAQIASGGEVSRVTLAIKAALADKAELSVLIFDEIDTGISGETANKVGKVMQKLAQRYQVIAITHLPQIAGKGARHFKIYKEVVDEKTVSNLRPLEDDERVLELARMLSGAEPTPSAIENAKELISSRNK
jgi:DNA repair protein RecN (Recombination protein N)